MAKMGMLQWQRNISILLMAKCACFGCFHKIPKVLQQLANLMMQASGLCRNSKCVAVAAKSACAPQLAQAALNKSLLCWCTGLVYKTTRGAVRVPRGEGAEALVSRGGGGPRGLVSRGVGGPGRPGVRGTDAIHLCNKPSIDREGRPRINVTGRIGGRGLVSWEPGGGARKQGLVSRGGERGRGPVSRCGWGAEAWCPGDGERGRGLVSRGGKRGRGLVSRCGWGAEAWCPGEGERGRGLVSRGGWGAEDWCHGKDGGGGRQQGLVCPGGGTPADWFR